MNWAWWSSAENESARAVAGSRSESGTWRLANHESAQAGAFCPARNSPRQAPVEKAHNHLEGIFGFGNVRVVEESMKQPFPDMKLGIHA